MKLSEIKVKDLESGDEGILISYDARVKNKGYKYSSNHNPENYDCVVHFEHYGFCNQHSDKLLIIDKKEKPKPKYLINSSSSINGIDIAEEIFDEELYDYRIIDVETEIENLCMWIKESNRPDQTNLMIEDLNYLLNIEDEYVFSCISTNDYVGLDKAEQYEKIATEILEINKNL